jgi:hypothetical protein
LKFAKKSEFKRFSTSQLTESRQQQKSIIKNK